MGLWKNELFCDAYFLVYNTIKIVNFLHCGYKLEGRNAICSQIKEMMLDRVDL